ncbi:MAG: hypothetical protein ABIF06_02445 [bacterium]
MLNIDGEIVLVTHYAQHVLEREYLVPLGFVTRFVGDATRYFFGFDFHQPLPAEEIAESERKGFLCALDQAHRIRGDQGLWMSPNGDVWLARDNDPEGDPMRLLVRSV